MDKTSPPNTDRGRTLAQILIALVVIVLLVNVPISYRGTGLIHSVPEATAVVIRDGMVLQGSDQVTYVLENHRLRPFSGPDTFNYFRQRYYLPVHVIEDDLLTQFAQGQPIRRLVTCDALPNVYSLENGQKRLINISFPTDPTNRWDKVGTVTCKFLQAIPDGSPIF
jgi:hypothetical protein